MNGVHWCKKKNHLTGRGRHTDHHPSDTDPLSHIQLGFILNSEGFIICYQALPKNGGFQKYIASIEPYGLVNKERGEACVQTHMVHKLKQMSCPSIY